MLVSIFRFQLKPNSPLYSDCSGLLGCRQYLSKWEEEWQTCAEWESTFGGRGCAHLF